MTLRGAISIQITLDLVQQNQGKHVLEKALDTQTHVFRSQNEEMDETCSSKSTDQTRTFHSSEKRAPQPQRNMFFKTALTFYVCLKHVHQNDHGKRKGSFSRCR